MKQNSQERHILLVLHAYSTQMSSLITRAQQALDSSERCHFSVLLVAPEPAQYTRHTDGPVAVMQRELLEQGKQNMSKIAKEFSISPERQSICFGHYQQEIDAQRCKQPIDKVIVDKEDEKNRVTDELMSMVRKASQRPSDIWSNLFTSYFPYTLVK